MILDVPARWRWMIWATTLTLWTAALVTPFAVQAGHEVLPEDTHYPVSKLLHLAVYAGLVLLTAWLPASRRLRPWLLALLLAHGPLTEFVQCYVPLRFGSLADVGLDSLGIVVGLLLTRPWWLEAFHSTPDSLILKHPANDTAPTDRQRSA